jgi:hypothetical protein
VLINKINKYKKLNIFDNHVTSINFSPSPSPRRLEENICKQMRHTHVTVSYIYLSLHFYPLKMAEPPKTHIPCLQEIRQRTLDILRYRPCLWQIRVVEALLQQDKDVISIAATGSGKTLTFWMPLLFRLDGIQIIITPLNILGKQNVNSLTALGISSIALSAENATIQNFKVRLLCKI